MPPGALEQVALRSRQHGIAGGAIALENVADLQPSLFGQQVALYRCSAQVVEGELQSVAQHPQAVRLCRRQVESQQQAPLKVLQGAVGRRR